MSTPNEPIHLDRDALFSPAVEEYLEERSALRQSDPDFAPQPLIVRILYSNYFYLSIACALGGFIAWLIVEPFFDDNEFREEGNIAAALIFPTVAALIGLFLGATEGIICRNPLRATISAAIGLGVGFGGGLVALIPAGIVFTLMSVL